MIFVFVMRLFFLSFVFLLCLFFLPFIHVFADTPEQLDYHEEFVRASIVRILDQKTESIGSFSFIVQTLQVRLLEGSHAHAMVTTSWSTSALFLGSLLHTNELVVIDAKPNPLGQETYTVYEPYRLSIFWAILLIFIGFVLFIARKRGVGALLGLLISLGIIGYWIIPQILQGHDALFTIILGCLGILVITTYIAHGISLKTTIAIFCTAISLLFAGLLSFGLFFFLHIFGFSNQDLSSIQLGTTYQVNPQGLLLGSVLLGTLGALNDITTTQAITIFTLIHENPSQHFRTLFRKGMKIGDEHIASLVNTLVLAYAGSSLALFVLFAVNSAHLPWWFLLNSELTMEEILKMLVGSSALILAVPLTTACAAWIGLKRLPRTIAPVSKTSSETL